MQVESARDAGDRPEVRSTARDLSPTTGQRGAHHRAALDVLKLRFGVELVKPLCSAQLQVPALSPSLLK